jgi:alkaline phosphatase D
MAGPKIIGRRDLLTGAITFILVAPAVLAAGACTSSDDDAKGPFRHGIASGDPLSDSVILWTRVTADAPVDVQYEVAEDPDMAKKVTAGSFATSADRDFTVKVDVKGLKPATTYYYRFTALGSTSKVGRMRTAPTGPTTRIRFALVACASLAHGYFHGYRALAKELDLDAVVHLGDYLYEYGSNEYGDVRPYEPPHEIKTLADYRMRHAQYKAEPDLKAIHQQHTFITIWDDHEIANDGYKDGADNHTEGAEGSWAERKVAALKAYREWMPIRDTPDGRIFRTIPYGDLIDLILLDTRYWARTIQSGGVIGPPPPPDASRSLLGDEQAKWLEDQLKTSTAKWKLIGQQVMVGNLLLESGAKLANLDQWHGYPESRKRLLDFFRDSGVKNIVVLTGDIHSSWANELVHDPNDKAAYDPATGRGSLAVEIVTPGISSPGIPSVFLGLVDSARPFNSHIRWLDPSRRGFVILDVTPERVQSAWHLFDDIVLPDPVDPKFVKAYSVKSGETRLNEDPTAAPGRDSVPVAAPT